MNKPISLILTLSIIGPWGCASTDRLNARLDLMEKEVSDLHQMNRRLMRRLDEIQMQISLLKKKLPQPASGSESPLPQVPALKVVKLQPDRSGFKVDRPRRKPELSSIETPVDPRNVSERLIVDHEAARRPLMGSDQLGPDPDGEDEETILRKFGHACSFYNAADFKTAVSALKYFIRLYPEHPLAIDAMHLVGEAELAQGKFQEAQNTFNTLTERHPKSKRSISALLMAGECEEKLGYVKQARSTYLQLVEAHPLSREAAEANRRLQAMR
jgi:tol-pal system protein YbgF